MKSEKFTVKFAETAEEKDEVFALRYRDMILEYRNDIVCEDGRDKTAYDEFAKHVICIDNETKEIAGSYRLVSNEDLPQGEKFVCEEEFDITEIKDTGESILELSRAVIKKEYRSSIVLTLVLQFVLQYIRKMKFRFVIGEASFFGTDKNVWQKELSYLAHYYAIDIYRVKSLEKQQVEILPKETLDVQELKRNLPTLIRGYLSFGAKVSSESFTDREFGSVDVFVLIDFQNYNEAYVERLLRLK